MFLDHLGQVFFPNILIFVLIGRLAFPLFAWGIAKGFTRTNNAKKYVLRLLCLALISQYPHDLLFESDYLNVCFTLLAGLLILCVYEYKMKIYFKIPIILSILYISHSLNFEYGVYGIAIIICFYVFQNIKCKYYLIAGQIVVQTIVNVIGIKLYGFDWIQLVSVLSVLIITLFERYDFKIKKLLRYCFYPTHIILLLLLRYILINT